MDDNFEKCEYFYLENSLTALKENVFGTFAMDKNNKIEVNMRRFV